MHTFTGKSPLQIVEGCPKPPPILRMHSNIFAGDEYVHDIKIAFQMIKEAIELSQQQQKQKRAVDKHQRPLELKEDEWVLLEFPKAHLHQR